MCEQIAQALEVPLSWPSKSAVTNDVALADCGLAVLCGSLGSFDVQETFAGWLEVCTIWFGWL